MKLYFMHYSGMVFILFNTGVCKSAFSTDFRAELLSFRNSIYKEKCGTFKS